jgi:hypothetical protein
MLDLDVLQSLRQRRRLNVDEGCALVAAALPRSGSSLDPAEFAFSGAVVGLSKVPGKRDHWLSVSNPTTLMGSLLLW